MKELLNRLDKLLTIKSIVTVVLTGIFAYLAVRGIVSGEQFLVIFTTVIAFYFGTQAKKE
ncbi:MAG: hypothetical protein DBY45_01775 [Clostridiales bacterium]|nr:MAG: hypothetical protein DBY45_01775 [Clostridiales bacterium]